MSGGVDSSVAAYLLKEQGYNVTGFFMKFWHEEGVEDNRPRKCCSVEEFMDAQSSAALLDIPLYTLNFEQKFKEDIVDDFIDAYKEGFTPNPCVRCNQFVKFGEFLKRAEELGFDYVATGHYAKVSKDNDGIFHILKGDDDLKDQSYFLYNLNQDILSKTLFPIGFYHKTNVREIAAKIGMRVSNKKGSSDLCFVANNDLKSFLGRHMTLSEGDIRDIDTEEILGQHTGLQAYTTGQRKGLGLAGGPWYVISKNMKNNILYVTRDVRHPDFFTGKVYLSEYNFLSGVVPQLPKKVTARTRYNQVVREGVLNKDDSGLYVEFVEPRRAVTPGQSLVFYDGDYLVGGGKISV